MTVQFYLYKLLEVTGGDFNIHDTYVTPAPTLCVTERLYFQQEKEMKGLNPWKLEYSQILIKNYCTDNVSPRKSELCFSN